MSLWWDEPEGFDECLMRARNGESEAYQMLMAHYRLLMICTLKRWRHFRAWECVQEGVSDTWIRMWRGALQRFTIGRRFAPYLVTVCRRAGASHIEGCRPPGTAPLEDDWPEADKNTVKEAEAQLSSLHTYLRGQLEGKALLIFLLKYSDGMEADEIAAVTGLTISQVNESLRTPRALCKTWLTREV